MRFYAATIITLAILAAPAAAEVSFTRDVKPLLARRCFACHGPETSEGGLRLDRHDGAIAELDSGAHAIVPNDADESELLARVTSDDESERMPPEGEPLTADEVASLRGWIQQGAVYEKHWAFIPPERREPPTVTQADWIRNPIDAFILAKLESHGLGPAPPTDRRTLARRAYFNLTGLPPTNDQLAEFYSDESPDAFARLVDKLLDSPHYGERWARHWLDVVRYAESNSFERDNPKPNVWKYRDYVIRSFNDDKPYDQFLVEQLAGDELAENQYGGVTRESIIATGYYRLGVWDDEPADPVQAYADEIDDLITTTGKAMLGLTINCARCHDHKIDPIPQTDYYGFAAFFADVTTYGVRSDQQSNNQWSFAPPEALAELESLEGRKQTHEAERLAIEQAGIARMSAADQRKTESREREQVLKEKLHEHLTPDERTAYAAVRRKVRAVQKQISALPEIERALALARTRRPIPRTYVAMRGNPHTPGEEVAPHFPELFGAAPPELLTPADDAKTAGRRRALAQWIASPNNMLTARVIVNRVWQHHFGRGIVRSASNFGELGTPPTHPELLDWLALWLVDNDWRLKPLHQLIMDSNAYRMSSRASTEARDLDPTNDLFSHFDLRRLDAEEIRDAALAVTGELNPKLYGPSIYSKLSADVLATQSRPGANWGESTEQQRARRSIYIHVKRTLIDPLLTAFDFPETDVSCEARYITTQPGQALAMVNGAFFNERAAKLAQRVRKEAGDDPEEKIRYALRITLGRQPEETAVVDGVTLYRRLLQEHGQSPEDALRYWCLAVLNMNELIYLD